MADARRDSQADIAMALQRSVAIILAGGQGQRLSPLTNNMAKPAVRFAGAYRMIDFTLSNCINSGLRRVYLLTQYASSSLNRHVRKGWGTLLSDDLKEFIDLVPPQKVYAERWYAGTADAVFQNINLLQYERPEYVVLLSGDHAYKMDYREMLVEHINSGADLTIASIVLPVAQCSQLGVVQADPSGRAERFVEKSPEPPSIPDDPAHCLVNMGVYIWRTKALVKQVVADARRATSHDFGKDIIPAMVGDGRPVHTWRFRAAGHGAPNYWRDIGTLSSYWQAHMDLVSEAPSLDLYDLAWPIYTHRPVAPPARICGAGNPEGSQVADALLAAGCRIDGGRVTRSVLSPGVHVQNADVHGCVLMDDVVVEPGAHLNRVVVAEGVRVPAGMTIGIDPHEDPNHFIVTPDGVTVVPNRIALDE